MDGSYYNEQPKLTPKASKQFALFHRLYETFIKLVNRNI